MPELSKWQIATKHGKAGACKGLSHRLQQARLSVAACSMRNDQAISGRRFRPMKKSADRRIAGSIREALYGIHAADYLTSGQHKL